MFVCCSKTIKAARFGLLFCCFIVSCVRFFLERFVFPDFCTFRFSNRVHFVLPDSIANLLSSMDKEISSLEVKITKYERIKQGMMQQLLTGKIRLINALHHTKEYPILQTDNTYSFVAEP